MSSMLVAASAVIPRPIRLIKSAISKPEHRADKEPYLRRYGARLTAAQQQHSSSDEQFGHSLGEGLALHSEGRHPQLAHYICKELEQFDIEMI
jgi:hypothetical protein